MSDFSKAKEAKFNANAFHAASEKNKYEKLEKEYNSIINKISKASLKGKYQLTEYISSMTSAWFLQTKLSEDGFAVSWNASEGNWLFGSSIKLYVNWQ